MLNKNILDCRETSFLTCILRGHPMCCAAEGRHGPQARSCDIIRVSRRWVTSTSFRLRQAGKTQLLLRHIHTYARAYLPACLPTTGIARVRLHLYPTRDGRAPNVGWRAPSRRHVSLSLSISLSIPVSRFALGKVMSGAHWGPIDKGRRPSAFLSPVSPPAASAIYIAHGDSRAQVMESRLHTCALLFPSFLLIPCPTAVRVPCSGRKNGRASINFNDARSAPRLRILNQKKNGNHFFYELEHFSISL